MDQHEQGNDMNASLAQDGTLSLPALSVAESLSRVDPELLDEKELAKHVALVNSERTRIDKEHRAIVIAYGQTITERIVRATLDAFPDAAYLEVGVLETFYVDEHGDRDEHREAEEKILAPYSVLDHNREPIGMLPPLSPVNYFLEQISPVMLIAPCRLNLELREWFYPLDSDDEESDFRITSDDFDDNGGLGNYWR